MPDPDLIPQIVLVEIDHHARGDQPARAQIDIYANNVTEANAIAYAIATVLTQRLPPGPPASPK